jgi:hypothetical protein
MVLPTTKMPTTEINYILAAALVLLLLASVAIACTCGGSAPCEAYAGVSVVFVGRVTKTGPRTEPVEKAEIILEKGKQQFRGFSNVAGKFELRGVSPGRYRVHTNPATNYSRIDASAEEPRKEWELEMPGHGCVQTWFAARAGGEISGRVGNETGVVPGDLYLPRSLRLAERMIEGVAVWPDGKPYVENCGISLTNPRTKYREGNCVSTDNEGHFNIKAIEGQTYHLVAALTDSRGRLISSKPLVLNVEKDNPPVKLIVESPWKHKRHE